MEPLQPDRWQRADRLFDEALDLPPDARAAFVDAACGDDVALRDAVLGLLAAADDAERIIGESAEHFAPSLVPSLRHAATAADAVPSGSLIGPWRVVSEIARGGMGAVYLAERADGEFEKRVALKLVKRGMDTDEILRRFHHERRILASLEHPSIARLYDGGAAPDGRPYLVMELVDGLPITRWCDEQRCEIDTRLDLFLTLCDAVQYAHGRLIVHRDIKPSNILVSADGTPRLLDFGIAKLLDDDAAEAQTRTGLRLATPEYAAPEQLRGEPISIATDVYALGVLLYELLSGQRPFAAARPHEAVHPPQRPSTTIDAAAAAARGTSTERLRRRLAGELDTIVLKALEDEPARRYASVADFMADVRRHLDGLPIRARPATRLYRARKFVLRNRAPAAFAALAVLSLLGGTAAAMLQARQAARERDAALHERARAEQVTGFLVGLFESADPTGSDGARSDTLRVRAVLDRGAERIRAELAGRPALQGELLTALARIYTSLGAYEPAESLARDALATAGESDMGEARATRLGVLARIAQERAELARADSLYAHAAAAVAAAGPHADSLYASFLAERGLIRSYLGDYDSAVSLLDTAYERARRASTAHGPLLSRIDNNHGMVRYDLGEYAAAEALFRRAYEAERAHQRANHPVLASALNNIASSVQYQGRNAEAEPIFVQAIETARDGLGADHTAVGDYLQNLATLYDDERRHDEAEPLYREALRIYERALGRHSPRTALLLRNLALNREAVGELGEAASLLREIEASLTHEVGADHFYTVVTSTALARVLTALGERREAFDRLSAGIERLEAQLPAGHFLIEVARRDLGAWYAEGRDFARAEPLLLASHTALVEGRGPDNVLALEARELLRRLYEAWGRPERAAALSP